MDEVNHRLLVVVSARLHADGANKTSIMAESVPVATSSDPPGLRHLFEDSNVHQHVLQRSFLKSAASTT